MFNSRNLIILAASVAIIAIFGYILVLMLQPSPYARMVATHVASDNEKAASQILTTIKSSPKCDQADISRASLLQYYRAQECFMLSTEIHQHRRPTDAELSSHGNAFMTKLSSKLGTCMSPEKRQKLMGSIASGTNLQAFLDEIDRSKDLPGRLKRVSRKMACGS